MAIIATNVQPAALQIDDFLAGIADQVFAVDQEWRFVFVNERVSEVTGIPRERLLGRAIWELFPEVVGSEFERALRRAAAERTPVRFEYFYPPLDRWFENRAYPTAAGVVALCTDVTDRKRAEAGLRASTGGLSAFPDTATDVIDREQFETVLRGSHETFFHLVENAPFGVYVIDAQFRLRQLSAGAQKVFSMVRPLIGRDFAEVLRSIWPEPFAGQAIARFRHTLDTGERYHSADTTERRHDTDEVESYDWQIERITLPSGEFGVVCYFYDLTERRRAEQQIARLNAALHGRLEELESLMTVLPIAVLLAHDPACARITANPAGAATLRLAPGANASLSAPGAAALPFRFLKDGAEVPAESLPMHRAARLGRPVLGEELEAAFADGGVVSLYGSAVPLFDEARRVRGCLGVFMDISERKRAEAALRDADRRKDEFLATLSHELRNPLAPLRNSVHLLRRTAAGPGPAPRVLDLMERQVEHLVRLVDDLMEVSRITRGTLELRRKPVPLEAALRGAIETSDPLLRAGGHRLGLKLPPEPLVLDADPVRIAQVFANLLNNAAKYTDRGGLIQVAARRDGADAVVTVSDTGQGIEPAEMSQLFRMFSRSDRSSRRTQGGLGIGLALVRKLVELHGGTVSAHSEGRGKGSCFTVRLPLADPSVPAPPAAASNESTFRRLRMLVVDDNPDAADSMALLLGHLGAEVMVAHDGPQALAAFDAFHPHVVLLDIGLPGMDGYAVARRIGERADRAQTRIVAVTGWGQEEDRARARAAGFDHHLVKPADIETLRGLLAAATTPSG